MPGDDYIEKIVQSSFVLPLPERQGLESILFESLDEILEGTPEDFWDSDRWPYVYQFDMRRSIVTPRDVKRYINLLRTTYPLVIGEVDAIDFFAVQAMQLWYPKLHSVISENMQDFVGRRMREDSRDILRSTYDQYLANIDEDKRTDALSLMSACFDRVAGAYGKIFYGDDREWRRHHRVCLEESFYTYFQLSVPMNNIAASSLRAALGKADRPSELAEAMLEFSKIEDRSGRQGVKVLLQYIQDYIDDKYVQDNASNILQAIYLVGDDLVRKDEWSRRTDIPNVSRLWSLAAALLKTLPNEKARFDTMRFAISSLPSLMLITQHIGRLGREHGRFGDGTDMEFSSPLVTLEQQMELEDALKERLAERAKDRTLHELPYLGAIFALIDRKRSAPRARVGSGLEVL